MLRNKYIIECPYGAVHFDTTGAMSVYRGFISGNNEIHFKKVSAGESFQTFLPFGQYNETLLYIQQLEKNIEAILSKVASYTDRQELILRFCMHGGEPAIELADNCPSIAMILAIRLDKINDALKYFKISNKIIHFKRQEILKFCEYPSSKSIVKLLKKISAKQCSPLLFNNLKKIIQQNKLEQMKVLQHLNKISHLVVDTMTDPIISIFATPSFYQNVSNYPLAQGHVEKRYLMGEIRRISSQLPMDLVRRHRLKSLEDLERVHDNLVKQFHELKRMEILDMTFRKPPITKCIFIEEGQEFGIYPLTNGKSLYEEGEKMHHCIASYAHDIANDHDMYAYHVSLPSGENASFVIQREKEKWYLSEIRGPYNAEVSRKIKTYVKLWLARWNDKFNEI